MSPGSGVASDSGLLQTVTEHGGRVMWRDRNQVGLLFCYEGLLRCYNLPASLAFDEDISPDPVPTDVFAFVRAFFVIATGYDSCISENAHLHVAQRRGIDFVVPRFEFR